VFGDWAPPRPTTGAYSALPDPRAGFKKPLHGGREAGWDKGRQVGSSPVPPISGSATEGLLKQHMQ